MDSNPSAQRAPRVVPLLVLAAIGLAVLVPPLAPFAGIGMAIAGLRALVAPRAGAPRMLGVALLLIGLLLLGLAAVAWIGLGLGGGA